jgi:LPS export ABC transporter protein LptC
MRRTKRWGLTALLILLGLEILTIAPKRVSTSEDAAAKAEPSPKPSTVATLAQVMRGVHLVETGSGRKAWELDSDSAQGLKDNGAWKLQGVRVKFFGTTGVVYSVKGESGSVHTETKDMDITGDVVGFTSEGYTFKTKSLKYLAKDKTLSTNDDVQMSGPKAQGVFEMSGRGFSAYLDGSVMKLNSDVRALKDVAGGRDMSIKSMWARLNGRTNEAHFEGMVQVDLEQMRMTGNEADFVYERDSKTLKSLLLQGNVKVTDQQHWASSQYAQVLFSENEFVLYGNPRIIQDDNELRGEEIRFLAGGKEIRVSKARARVDSSSDVVNKGLRK